MARCLFFCSRGVESTCAVAVLADGTVRCRKKIGWKQINLSRRCRLRTRQTVNQTDSRNGCDSLPHFFVCTEEEKSPAAPVHVDFRADNHDSRKPKGKGRREKLKLSGVPTLCAERGSVPPDRDTGISRNFSDTAEFSHCRTFRRRCSGTPTTARTPARRPH